MTSKHAVCSNFKTTSSASPDFCATAWQSSTIGQKSNCSRCKSIACAIGAATACFASAILHMRCHRQAAWASISLSRMPSRLRTCSPENCEPVRFPWTICAKCRRAANGRRGSFKQCRFSFIVAWLLVVRLIPTARCLLCFVC